MPDPLPPRPPAAPSCVLEAPVLAACRRHLAAGVAVPVQELRPGLPTPFTADLATAIAGAHPSLSLLLRLAPPEMPDSVGEEPPNEAN